MPVLQFGTREAILNIVYDGPPFAGRSTALRHLHTRVENMPLTPILAREQAKAKVLSVSVPLAAGLIRPPSRLHRAAQRVQSASCDGHRP